MNERQIERLRIEIIRLRKEADQLESRANMEQESFATACASYGSELAGPPASIAIDRNMAKNARSQADFLEEALADDVDLSEISQIDVMVARLNIDIEELNRRKSELWLRKSALMKLEAIIGK